MKLFATFVLIVFTCSLSFSQGKQLWLKMKLQEADSIILVSHEATEGVIIADKDGNEIPLPKLLVNGKPNYNIIKEKQVINDSVYGSLVKILVKPFRDLIASSSGCFTPHHAIFIIKNNKTSYIDICFECRNYETSEDLSKMEIFDSRKWNELFSYFKKQGFKYEMEK